MLLWRSIYLLFVGFHCPLLVATALGAEFDAIAFHRATETKSRISKNAQTYERVTVMNGKNRFEYDVERSAAYVIKDRVVESLIVEKTRRFGSTPSELLELGKEVYRKDSKSSPRAQSDSPFGYSYDLVFRIALQEGRRFMSFANANLGNKFNLRVDNHSVGVLIFDIPFDRQTTKYFEFTAPVLEDDADKLKKMLSRFSGKVIWQE
jgi:hypothetical protein